MPIEQTVIDHIVVTASDLETGVAYVRETLGIEPDGGGEHPKMGTHNRLLRCGPACYLEVIAINPNAPAPARPRWFGLDDMTGQIKDRSRSPFSVSSESSRSSFATAFADAVAPRLAAWVVRTTDIHGVVATSSESLGVVTPMQRGNLDWLITIPETGLAPLDGLAPALIEWHTPSLPVLAMPDHGLLLEKLEIYHPEPERMQSLIASLNLQAPVSVLPCPSGSTPGLKAMIRTSDGIRELS